jgi:uncharacterized membrane protein
MFFKKRRDAKETAMADARRAVLKDLRDRFDAAQDCLDPGEKLLKLEEIRQMVDAATGALKGNIAEKAGQAGELTMLGTMSAGTASAWLVLGLHFPPLLGLVGIVAGTVGGVRAGRKMIVHSRQKQFAKNRPFINDLEAEKTKAVAAADVLLETRLRDIAASPRFDDIVTKVPRVRDHFTAAYARKVAEEKDPDAPVPPKRPADDHRFRL